MEDSKTLRILIYDKLDEKGRAMPGERRAMAAFSDEKAQIKYIEDAKLEGARIKSDYFQADRQNLPETAQPDHICYALYKKWSRDGAFELSGYSYTKSFEDTGAGYDQFVTPLLIDKTHEETQAWKDAAIRARLGSGKAYRDAKKALARLSEQEREKREAEFFTDFAQNTYKVFKPKTQREVLAMRGAITLALIWIAVTFLLVPEEPSLVENANSVSWLPGASNVSYFRSPSMIAFECSVPWQRAQSYANAQFQPVQDLEVMSYRVYIPNANPEPMQGLKMNDSEAEEWNTYFKRTVKDGYRATFEDGSYLVYDSNSGQLYGFVQGETRKQF